jgi:hypothetical protein
VGEDETGEPFLGASGSGTLPVRAGDDGTTASSSASGLWTGTTAGTCAGRRQRGERQRQHNDDDGTRWHGSPGAVRTGNGGARRSDRRPRARQRSASDRCAVGRRLYTGAHVMDSTGLLVQSADGVWWLSR